MMKKINACSKTDIRKRLVAIMVAVVFVLGTAYVPTGVFAAEGEQAAQAQTEQIQQAQPVTESETQLQQETPDEVDSAQQAAAEATGDDVSMEDMLLVLDEDGNEIGLDDLKKSEYDGFIYSISDDATKAEVREMENSFDDLGKDQEAEEVISNELYEADSIETIEEVAEPEMVELIEPNYIVHACGEPSDPYYKENKWATEMMNVPSVWGEGTFGDDITVAVIDSGVNTGHEDFAGCTFETGYNAINPELKPDDDFWHGTAVAGVIAAQHNNKGCAGLMPKTKIMPIKVIDEEGSGKTSAVIKGIDYARENGADVINLSLGGPGYVIGLEESCQKAVDKGIIVVASSGNYGNRNEGGIYNPVIYPAAFDCVISVASVESNKSHSAFSTYNDKVDVAAPGSGLKLLNITGYCYGSGTSFACPSVSAMAAMVKSEAKGNAETINQEQFRNLLSYTSTDYGVEGRDKYYGYGIADFGKAYNSFSDNIANKSVTLSGKSFEYTGKEIKPAVKVRDYKKTLVEGQDYEVIYPNEMVKTGERTVKVKGIGEYNGEKDLKYSIIPRSISRRNISLSGTSYTYSGGTHVPSVKVKDGNTALIKGRDYTVSYSGKGVAIGTYGVTVRGAGIFSNAKTVYYTVNPPLIKGIKNPSKGKGKVTVKWAKMSKKQKKTYKSLITGYQARAALNKNFSGAKCKNVKGYTKTSVTIKGLAKKKTYYVQYRTYKTVGGKTYYSKWSGTKSVKTK